MRAWSLLLVCGLRLHRCSDRAVARGGGRRHAPDKAALPGGVAETVLAQLKVDSADPGRAAQLRTAARGCRQLALAHPHVAPLLVTRPLATLLALRPLGTLRPAHLPRPARVPARPHPQLQELTGNPGETDDLLRLGLRRLPIGEIPLLRGLACVLAGYDGPAEPGRGPGILLAGLTTTLTPQAKQSASWPAAGRHRQDGDPPGRFPHAPQLLQQAQSAQHPGKVRGLNVRIGSAAPIRAGNLGPGSPAIRPQHAEPGHIRSYRRR
jgi:hypothetical protein